MKGPNSRMMMCYEPHTVDSMSRGRLAAAFYALDETFPKPTAFSRALAIAVIRTTLGCTEAQALNAYRGIYYRDLIETAN